MRATTLAHSGTSISSREQKKGIPTVRSVMTQERRNPFISGFFSLPLCILCHQNYRLDVARGNETTNSYPSLVQGNMSTDRCPFTKMRSGTYPCLACSSGTCQPFSDTCPLMGTCRQIVKERIEDGANEKAALRFPIAALSFASISIFPG